MKCDDPNKPICDVVKSNSTPESASSGAIPPDPSCKSRTERRRAVKEIISRMGPAREIPATTSPDTVAAIVQRRRFLGENLQIPENLAGKWLMPVYLLWLYWGGQVFAHAITEIW